MLWGGRAFFFLFSTKCCKREIAVEKEYIARKSVVEEEVFWYFCQVLYREGLL